MNATDHFQSSLTIVVRTAEGVVVSNQTVTSPAKLRGNTATIRR